MNEDQSRLDLGGAAPARPPHEQRVPIGEHARRVIDEDEALKAEVVEAARARIESTAPAARHTDPETSHEAARSTTNDSLTSRRLDVLRVFAHSWGGRMTQQTLVSKYEELRSELHLLAQSESGIRTRCAELVAHEPSFIEDSGDREQLNSGRRAIVWQLTLAGRGFLDSDEARAIYSGTS